MEPGRYSFSNKQLESNRDPKEQEEGPQEEGFQQIRSIQSGARIQPRQQEEAQNQTQTKGKGVEGFNLWGVNKSEQESAGYLSTSGQREDQESPQTRGSRRSRESGRVNILIDNLQSHFNNIEKLIVEHSSSICERIDFFVPEDVIIRKLDSI